MKKSKSPGAGGIGAYMGDRRLNKHLMKPQDDVERATVTRDSGMRAHDGDGWPSMWDMAKKLTKGKN